MAQQSNKPALMIFMVVLLLTTVGLVGLFAAHRRSQVTALSEPLDIKQLGFSIRMPLDWDPVGPMGTTPFGPGLMYRPARTASRGRSSQGIPSRYILLISIPVGASDEQTLIPLAQLAEFWQDNINEFYGYGAKPLGPTWYDQHGYARRVGYITYRPANPYLRNQRIELIGYQQITAGSRIFWCIIMGNTQLDAADQALLNAVANSFELTAEGDQQPKSNP